MAGVPRICSLDLVRNQLHPVLPRAVLPDAAHGLGRLLAQFPLAPAALGARLPAAAAVEWLLPPMPMLVSLAAKGAAALAVWLLYIQLSGEYDLKGTALRLLSRKNR